jgi:hypothetical protein
MVFGSIGTMQHPLRLPARTADQEQEMHASNSRCMSKDTGAGNDDELSGICHSVFARQAVAPNRQQSERNSFAHIRHRKYIPQVI